MAKYVLEDDKGNKYEIEASDNAKEADVLKEFQSLISKPQETPAKQRSFGEELGRQAGLTARYGLEGAASTLGIAADPIGVTLGKLTNTQYTPLGQAASQAATKLGLPQPEGDLEEVVGSASRGVAGAAGGVGAGLGLAKAGAGALGSFLSTAPSAQAVGGATSGAASEVARQEGAGTAGQIAAGIAGGLTPVAGAGLTQGAKKVAEVLTGRYGEKAVEKVVKGSLEDAIFESKGIGGNLKSYPKEQQPEIIRQRRELLDQVLAKIDETVSEVSGNNFRPTTGQASGDVGLIKSENSLLSEPQYAQRAVENQRAVREGVDQFTNVNAPGPEGDVPQALFEQKQQSRLAAGDKGVIEAEKGVSKAAEGLEQASDITPSPGGTTAASEAIDKTFRETLAQAKASKNKGYDLGEKGNTQIVPTKLKEVADAVGDLGPLSDPNTIPGRILSKIKSGVADETSPLLSANGKAITSPSKVSLKDLQDLRVWVSRSANDAYRAGNSVLGENLSRLKSAISEEYSLAGQADPELGKQLKQADEFFAKEYAPNFKEGEGGALAASIQRDVPGQNLPSQTAGRFLSGIKEKTQDLLRIADKSSNPEQARQDIRNYLVSDLAESLGERPTRLSINKWIARNKDTLDQVPEIKAEIQNIRNNFETASNNVSASEKALKDAIAAKKSISKADKEMASVRYFIGRDQDAIMGNILNKNNPRKIVDDLYREMGDNQEAKAGFKKLFSQHLAKTLENTGSNKTLDDRGTISLNALDKKVLGNDKVRRAMEAVYTPEEMAALDKVRNQLKVLDRSNYTIRSGSQTAERSEDVRKTINNTLLGVLYTKFGYAAVIGNKALQGLVNKASRVTDEKIKQKRLDVLLNPEDAKLLLSKPTDENIKKASEWLDETGAYTKGTVYGTESEED